MSEPQGSPVRKRRLDPEPSISAGLDAIDLATAAVLAYSSEDPTNPVEHLLTGCKGPGSRKWTSAQPDTVEQIVLEFDRPTSIARLVYEVEETARERTQEVRIEASSDDARTYQPVLTQEYTFSPHGATFEREELRVELHEVTHLRVVITPNKHGSGRATLSCLQLFG
jgi:hypothetical protein